MNSTYTLTEGNDALNRVLLMMQYELGKTLDEQTIPTDKDIKKHLDAERYNNTQKFVDNTAVSFRGPDGRQKTTATSPKVLKIQKPAFHMTLDEFMEEYRDALTHPVMVGLEVALTSTGVGVGAVVAAYTALLAYDVYKGVVEKDWNWLNIVFDILGIVSSGILSSTLRPIMKGAQGLKFKNFKEVFTYLTKTNKWYEIKPYLETGFSLLKSVSKGIWKALEWISRKTGFRQLKVAGKSVDTNVHNIIYSIEEFLKSSVKFLEPGAKVGIKTGIKRGIKWGTFAYFFKENIVPYLKGLSNEKTTFKRGVNSVQDELLDIISEKNKNLLKNKINEITFVTNSEHTLNTVIINDNEYEISSDYKLKQK